MARISSTVVPAVSSMKMGASDSIPVARVSFGQSESWRRPVLIRWESIRPMEQSMRRASCSMDISRLKTATGIFSIRAACWTMFMARAVLPMEGRPARMIRSEGCRPAVMRSSSS